MRLGQFSPFKARRQRLTQDSDLIRYLRERDEIGSDQAKQRVQVAKADGTDLKKMEREAIAWFRAQRGTQRQVRHNTTKSEARQRRRRGLESARQQRRRRYAQRTHR